MPSRCRARSTRPEGDTLGRGARDVAETTGAVMDSAAEPAFDRADVGRADTGRADVGRVDVGRLGASAGGLHRVEQIMGTAIGIDVRDRIDPAVIEATFAWFRAVDERFSTYRPESEISRLGRGEIGEADASGEVREVLALCDDLCRTTEGYFDARRFRPDGRLDPSGLVKGWSIEQAAIMLEAGGARNFVINAGGDVVAHGTPAHGQGWRVGIRHPRRADSVCAVLEVRHRSVATSGTYERGAHILDPHTHEPPTGLLALTVVGPSMTYADSYATAAFAMGRHGIAWVARHPGYGALGVTDDERVIWTHDLDALLVRAD